MTTVGKTRKLQTIY